MQCRTYAAKLRRSYAGLSPSDSGSHTQRERQRERQTERERERERERRRERGHDSNSRLSQVTREHGGAAGRRVREFLSHFQAAFGFLRNLSFLRTRSVSEIPATRIAFFKPKNLHFQAEECFIFNRRMASFSSEEWLHFYMASFSTEKRLHFQPKNGFIFNRKTASFSSEERLHFYISTFLHFYISTYKRTDNLHRFKHVVEFLAVVHSILFGKRKQNQTMKHQTRQRMNHNSKLRNEIILVNTWPFA